MNIKIHYWTGKTNAVIEVISCLRKTIQTLYHLLNLENDAQYFHIKQELYKMIHTKSN